MPTPKYKSITKVSTITGRVSWKTSLKLPREKTRYLGIYKSQENAVLRRDFEIVKSYLLKVIDVRLARELVNMPWGNYDKYTLEEIDRKIAVLIHDDRRLGNVAQTGSQQVSSGWYSRIYYGRKDHYLGSYTKREDAVFRRDLEILRLYKQGIFTKDFAMKRLSRPWTDFIHQLDHVETLISSLESVRRGCKKRAAHQTSWETEELDELVFDSDELESDTWQATPTMFNSFANKSQPKLLALAGSEPTKSEPTISAKRLKFGNNDKNRNY